jgi:hypothetical protein
MTTVCAPGAGQHTEREATDQADEDDEGEIPGPTARERRAKAEPGNPNHFAPSGHRRVSPSSSLTSGAASAKVVSRWRAPGAITPRSWLRSRRSPATRCRPVGPHQAMPEQPSVAVAHIAVAVATPMIDAVLRDCQEVAGAARFAR